MKSLPSDIKIGGLSAWHKGNHNSNKNPHKQYVLKNMLIEIETVNQTSNSYTLYEVNLIDPFNKIDITFTIINSNKNQLSTFNFHISGNGNNSEHSLVELSNCGGSMCDKLYYKITEKKILIYFKKDSYNYSFQTNIVKRNNILIESEVIEIMQNSSIYSSTDYKAYISENSNIALTIPKANNKYIKLFDVVIYNVWAEKSIKLDILSDTSDINNMVFGTYLLTIKRTPEGYSKDCLLIYGEQLIPNDIYFVQTDDNTISCYIKNRLNIDITASIASMTQISYKNARLYINTDLSYVDDITNATDCHYRYSDMTARFLYTFDDSGNKVAIKVKDNGEVYSIKV